MSSLCYCISANCTGSTFNFGLSINSFATYYLPRKDIVEFDSGRRGKTGDKKVCGETCIGGSCPKTERDSCMCVYMCVHMCAYVYDELGLSRFCDH